MNKEVKYSIEKDEIILQIVNNIIIAIMSGPSHTYNTKFLLLTDNEKTKFINNSLNNLNKIPNHFINRLIELEERLRNSSAILFVGFEQTSLPDKIDCGVCGKETCEKFFLDPNYEGCNYKKICPIDLMSFSSGITRGQQMANYLNVSNFKARSIGIAAREQKILKCEFAMGIILEVGKSVKTEKDNLDRLQ